MTDAEKLQLVLDWLADRRLHCDVPEIEILFQEIPEAREWYAQEKQEGEG